MQYILLYTDPESIFEARKAELISERDAVFLPTEQNAPGETFEVLEAIPEAVMKSKGIVTQGQMVGPCTPPDY